MIIIFPILKSNHSVMLRNKLKLIRKIAQIHNRLNPRIAIQFLPIAFQRRLIANAHFKTTCRLAAAALTKSNFRVTNVPTWTCPLVHEHHVPLHWVRVLIYCNIVGDHCSPDHLPRITRWPLHMPNWKFTLLTRISPRSDAVTARAGNVLP